MDKIQGFKAFKKTQEGRLFTTGNGHEKVFFEVGIAYFCNASIEVNCCSFGYHFCRDLTDVFNYYPLLESLAYCQVEGIFDVSKGDYDIDIYKDKIATRGIRIVKILTWEELLKQIRKEQGYSKSFNSNLVKGVSFCFDAYMIEDSYYINKSHHVKDSTGVNGSSFIDNSINIVDGKNIQDSSSVNTGNNIIESNLIFESNNISNSSLILNSNNICRSKNIIYSNLCEDSYYIYNSKNITSGYYVCKSNNIINGDYITACENIRDCFFCYDLMDNRLCIFNKKVDMHILSRVKCEFMSLLKSLEYKINFIKDLGFDSLKAVNSFTLYDFVIYNRSEHFKNFPQEAIDYLKSLPEFDAEIFEKITNIKVECK